MKFLENIIAELRAQNGDLSHFVLVMPGKRPVIFLKKVLAEQQYSGILPLFFTIEDLLLEISGKQLVQGISLWLFAFEVYKEQHPSEEFSSFLKWFPTVVSDWDDMMQFGESDEKVLDHLLAEERIKNWSETLGFEDQSSTAKHISFWRRMKSYLPALKEKLQERNWATMGMIHETVRAEIPAFADRIINNYVFCGFNAIAPAEKMLIRELMQRGKAQCFFEADEYYIRDERQEAGQFLREMMTWKEFNPSREFKWLTSDFAGHKNICVYETSGNISQAKVLPEIFKNTDDPGFHHTAVVLLDENLLPACLDALSDVEKLNITMGFPLKNLSFSNAIRQLFYLQKQLEKNAQVYYYTDVLAVLDEFPSTDEDQLIITQFKALLEERNLAYIPVRLLNEQLENLSYKVLLEKAASSLAYLDLLTNFCFQLKFRPLDDILYENVSLFEKNMKVIRNQLTPYHISLSMETLEVLFTFLVNTEVINFEGEPLQGLQLMGLLETRLLNFKNVILLSANEGKLPPGNSLNSYLPFAVRRQFGLHTFLDTDSIYAYHFYRLLQGAENIHILYNALSSGTSTGEQSRFITQLQIEDKHHTLEHVIVENTSKPVSESLMKIEKTPAVLERLGEWQQKISVSSLTSYLYNPVDFYLSRVLKLREGAEIEEQISQRSYGTLVHYALEIIYEKLSGNILQEEDLNISTLQLSAIIDQAIVKMSHDLEHYRRGMNYIHRSVAERVVRMILQYDLGLIRSGHQLEIIGIEKEFRQIQMPLENGETVAFTGLMDRVDRLDGQLRIIDYKTAKIGKLEIKESKNSDGEAPQYFLKDEMKQAMQLSVYAYAALQSPDFDASTVQCGIWSFASASAGPAWLTLSGEEKVSKELVGEPMRAVEVLINEILNPELSFEERVAFTANA